MRKPTKDSAICRVAYDAARVLRKYGIETADYKEWVNLKDSLLQLHPHLDTFTATEVGHACSEFNLKLAEIRAQADK